MSDDNTEETEWKTRKEAAEYLSMSVHTLANWVQDPGIVLPYYKVGKQVRYKVSDLDAFREKCRIG